RRRVLAEVSSTAPKIERGGPGIKSYRVGCIENLPTELKGVSFNRQLPGLAQIEINGEIPIPAQTIAFAGLTGERVGVGLQRGCRDGEEVRPRFTPSARGRRVLRSLLKR